jgi:hypothetical protein
MHGVRGPLRLVLLGLLIGVLVAACGRGPDASTDPQAAVQDALKRMASWDGATATFAIDSTAPSLLAAFADEGLDERMVRLVLDSSLTFSVLLGDDLLDRTDGETSVTFLLGGVDVFSLVQFDEDLYVRVDLDRIVEVVDRDGTGKHALDGAQAEAEAHGLDFAADLRRGSWLKVTGLKQVQAMIEGMYGAPSSPDPAELAALAPELREAFDRFLEGEVDFAFLGRDDHGDHIRVTTTGRALIDLGENIYAIAGGLLPDAPGMSPAQMFDELRREVGSKAEGFTVPLDVWISNGVISRVAFDIVALAQANPEQMAEEIPVGVERLGIAIELSEFGGGLQAPAGATEIDLFEYVGRVMGGAFSLPDS